MSRSRLASLFTLAAGGVLAALPALLLRGVHGDWKGFMLWYGRGLIALALVLASGVVHRGLTEPPSSLLESLRNGQITIDRFVRAERAAAPGMFDQRLLATHERALRQSFPDGTFSDVSLVRVTDGAGWLRAHMTYQARLNVQGESVSTRGQMVVYYHRAGTAVIGAACTADERGVPPDRPAARRGRAVAADPVRRGGPRRRASRLPRVLGRNHRGSRTANRSRGCAPASTRRAFS